MNKQLLNKYFRKFGFEVHGLGYLQSVQKTSFRENAFTKQKELVGENVNCIFDIGANRGDILMQYKNLFPVADIYAFEPFPASYQILVDKVKEFNNVHHIQKAVGDKPGKSIFYVNKSVDTNSLLPSKETGLSSDKQVVNKGQIEVEVCTVDQFCETNNIHRIDILKLDIQGGEFAALKGCEKMLASKQIKLIYTEAYFVEQYVGHPLFHDISSYLHQHDYHLQDLYDPYYGNGAIAWCDAIFLPGN